MPAYVSVCLPNCPRACVSVCLSVSVSFFYLTTGRTSEQERHLTVGDGLLGEIVEDDEGVFAVVTEVLAHGGSGVRSQVLQGSGVGSRGRHHDAKKVRTKEGRI